MSSLIKTLAFVAALVVGTLVLMALLGANRVIAPFAEETRRLTYEQSRSYNQGVAVDLDDLCRQWRNAAIPDVRAGLSDTIQLRASRYDLNQLPPHVRACVNEAITQ